MKRLFVLLLLAALLLSGCSAAESSKEQVFNQYGIAITVDGTAQVASGGNANQFTLYTNVGTLEFSYYSQAEVPVTEKNVVDFANTLSETPTVDALQNGAYLITLPPRDGGNGINIVESYYLIQLGSACWRVYAVSLEPSYNKEALTAAMLSLRFANRSK